MRRAATKSATTTARATRVERDVIEVLARCHVNESAKTLTLPEQLERKLYQRTNDVLVAIGAVWNRKAKAHVFDYSPTAALELVIATGEVVTHRDLGWFATPASLADELVERSKVCDGESVLEPSAGEGAIALAARARGGNVTCVELHAGRAATLRGQGFETFEGDFLTMGTRTLGGPRHLTESPRLFDAIIMNPPFSPGRADLAHVQHAMKFMRRGGVLVAVMAAGITFRSDKQSEGFRSLIASLGGSIELLPDGAFEESGTGVRACVVEVRA